MSIRIRGRRKAIICQIRGDLPLQACGAPADQIYKCEQIGPHDKHQVDDHTILHERVGNGYSCRGVQDLIDEHGGFLQVMQVWNGARLINV